MKILSKQELLYNMSYPIGQNIAKNLPKINFMGKIISEEYKDSKSKGINLYCRGSSGAIISAIVSNILIDNGFDCSIIHVKKEGESSHNSSFYPLNEGVNVIIDDFMASGDTINQIHGKINSYFGGDIKIDALVLSGAIESCRLDFDAETYICGYYE